MTLLRQLPSVDRLAHAAELAPERAHHGASAVTQAARQAIARAREELQQGGTMPALAELVTAVQRVLVQAQAQSLQPLINATGVVLHTNLGRAPLAPAAIDAVARAASGYSNLEFDLESGQRGSRQVHVRRLLQELTGAEAALVVNNNAAATLLALAALAAGKEVIVSRGELIEIGGKYRLPDVIQQGGAKLVEVGTTNRTRLADYEQAITSQTALLLKVHTSNYRLVGFTEAVPARELAALAKKHSLLALEDLGSGVLVDTSAYGLEHEPMVQEAVSSGVDLVTFSGDKLLGGPQAGIILGRAEVVERLYAHPLMRALRPDKLTLAALAATLQLYATGQREQLPIWQMLRPCAEDLAQRARAVQQQVGASPLAIALSPGQSATGGGSLPGETLPTTLLVVTHPQRSAEDLASALRSQQPPVVGRIERDQLLLDLRTVLPDQDALVIKALQALG